MTKSHAAIQSHSLLALASFSYRSWLSWWWSLESYQCLFLSHKPADRLLADLDVRCCSKNLRRTSMRGDRPHQETRKTKYQSHPPTQATSLINTKNGYQTILFYKRNEYAPICLSRSPFFTTFLLCESKLPTDTFFFPGGIDLLEVALRFGYLSISFWGRRTDSHT
jgi:hypothetical protein